MEKTERNSSPRPNNSGGVIIAIILILVIVVAGAYYAFTDRIASASPAISTGY